MKSEQKKFREGIIYSLSIVSFLWLVKLIEFRLGSDLSYLGILPRTLEGSVGIFTSPFIHGDINHLVSNSFPLLLLLCGLVYFYNSIASRVVLLIYGLTGIAVWAFAREAYHIGASGIIYGLVSFMFVMGILRRDSGSIAISLTVVFLYSGMLYGLFPDNPDVSYESHIMGSVSGALTAFVFRRTVVPVQNTSLKEVESKVISQNDNKYKYVFKANDKNDDSQDIHYTIDT